MSTVARALCPVRRTPDAEAEQVTQLLPGEPVEVLETAGDWVRVLAPWQPSSLDPAGYPGWALGAHLGEVDRPVTQPARDAAGGAALVAVAVSYLDTPYLWGGLSLDGIDCSGLVHRVARAAGLRVPRDAADQGAVLPPVDLDDVAVGDVYLFARPQRPVHHVGLATAPAPARRMLHAPDSGPVRRVLEEELPAERLATLVGAVRLQPS